MPGIVTLTLNPAIDIAAQAEEVRHTRKIRTFSDHMEPGGGGINVARALTGFGAPVHAIYLAGGATGPVLDALLERHGIERTAIPIAGDTRVSLNVFERMSGLEYRFVPEGPCVSEEEWRAALAAAAAADCEYFVASGSLSECLPDEFYAELADQVGARSRLVLDTSGPELQAALKHGGLFLVKPSRGELEQLVGEALKEPKDIGRAAMDLVDQDQAEHVAVSLGSEGAVLASSDGAFFLPAVPVEACSAVGAGDSFVAAMTFAFFSGMDARAAFRMGMAAGAAAVRSPGTELCRADLVDELLGRVGQPEPISL